MNNKNSIIKQLNTIESVMNQKKNSIIKDIKEYYKLHKESIKSPEKFWKKMAGKYLHFFHKGKKIYEFNMD